MNDGTQGGNNWEGVTTPVIPGFSPFQSAGQHGYAALGFLTDAGNCLASYNAVIPELTEGERAALADWKRDILGQAEGIVKMLSGETTTS